MKKIQIVVRSENSNTELSEKLSEGYKVVICNKVLDKYLEYILEKEVTNEIKESNSDQTLTMKCMDLARDLQAIDVCIATRSWVNRATDLISNHIKKNYLKEE
jgi:hypothetical protein